MTSIEALNRQRAVKPASKGREHLSDLLDKLRKDEELRKNIRVFRDLLRRELLEKTNAFEARIHAVVCSALERISRVYITAQWGDGAAGVLLSYDSLLRRASRITDLIVRPISATTPTWAADVTEVLRTEAVRVLADPYHVEIHRLALQRVAYDPEQVFARVPLYVSVQPAVEKLGLDELADLGIDMHADEFVGMRAGEIVCTCGILREGKREEDLKALVLSIAKHSDPNTPEHHKYPRDLTALNYADYVRYIEKLLFRNPVPLWLSTIAVSDELSDLPLGSIMVFSEHPPAPSLLSEVRDIVFEFMNALRRVEHDIRTRRDEAGALALWFAHEVKNIRKIVVNAQEHLSTVPDGRRSTEIIEVSRRLDLLSDYAELMWKTISSLSGAMNDVASPEKFREYLSAVPEVFAVPMPLTFECEVKVPLVYVFICMELVRNAIEQAIKSPNGTVCASVKMKDRTLRFIVQSSPNEPDTARRLRERFEQPDVRVAVASGMGLRVLKQLEAILGGNCAVTWRTPRGKETSCAGVATLQL